MSLLDPQSYSAYPTASNPTDLDSETQLLVILADYSNDLYESMRRGGKLPAQAAVERLQAIIARACDDLLYDLDEIENKPWRVFRQLALIMPEYADTYRRYEEFYSHGGGNKVMALIEEFEAEAAQKGEQ